MRRCQFRVWAILTAIALLGIGCSQADPAFAPAGASDASPVEIAAPDVTATPTTSFPAPATPFETSASNQNHDVAWIDLRADFAVRTAAQAEAMAFDLAHSTFDASHPHVARVWLLTQREMAQGSDQVLGEGDDPLALIWWVDLDHDDYVSPRCPAPPVGATRTNCGSAPLAALQFFASDGQNLGLTVGRNFTPATDPGDITLPTAARLRTEGEAIAAALQMVPGTNGQVPHVINLRLLSVQLWMQEEAERGARPNLGLAQDAPLWEIELSNAAYPVPCLRVDTSQCAPERALFLFNAINGEPSGIFGPPPPLTTPAP